MSTKLVTTSVGGKLGVDYKTVPRGTFEAYEGTRQTLMVFWLPVCKSKSQSKQQENTANSKPPKAHPTSETASMAVVTKQKFNSVSSGKAKPAWYVFCPQLDDPVIMPSASVGLCLACGGN